jgi:hypothetical protein
VIPSWSPETWGDFSVVGIVVIIAALFFWSLVREWIVIGRYHRDVVGRLDARAEKDAEAIHTLSTAISEKNGTEEATTRILGALRQVLGSGGER